MTIRPATSEDVDAITEVWRAGWRDAHIGRVPDALLAHRDAASFRNRVPVRLATTVVAVVDEQLAGFVVTHLDEIEQVYVGSAFRGTGVATALLHHGERVVAAGFERAWLAVVDENRRARRFYERNGWYDAGPFDNPSWTAAGPPIAVPCRRYQKELP